MFYPNALRPGDRISIIAPSGVVEPGYVEKTRKIFENWGLQVILGEHLFKKYGRFAGTASERLHDLQNSLDDPDIQAVFFARGGYGTVDILDRISLDKFKQNPKWLIGFSDITILHSLISGAGICSLHAPMSAHLAEEGENELSALYLKKILFGEKPEYRIGDHDLNRNGSCSGYIRGGNLSILSGLRGTPYDLLTENTILFLEDIDEQAYHIDRMMQNLKLGGILEKISGLIIGRFSGCHDDPQMNCTIYESIFHLVERYDYPVCFDFPVGHVNTNYPLIENGKAQLNVENSNVYLKFI
ncbi:MAG: LD-carboxypeptidase [Dysgonamonadaceae bacterium]|jgi:muramoyltetrapeptide carboxypeptidase|nr:LD-carboxypeptidase [Dysgonamonadaceae bacterium]